MHYEYTARCFESSAEVAMVATKLGAEGWKLKIWYVEPEEGHWSIIFERELKDAVDMLPPLEGKQPWHDPLKELDHVRKVLRNRDDRCRDLEQVIRRRDEVIGIARHLAELRKNAPNHGPQTDPPKPTLTDYLWQLVDAIARLDIEERREPV